MSINTLLWLGGAYALYRAIKNRNPLTVNSESGSTTSIINSRAYVNSQGGAMAFKSLGQNAIATYGYGREPILTFGYRTYLGTATGRYSNGMVEIQTTINTQNVVFWVQKDAIKIVSESEYSELKDSIILEKSESVKRKLLNV